MRFISYYNSPLGSILLSADEKGLNGLWFENQKYFPVFSSSEIMQKETKALSAAKCWLDIYFKGNNPDFVPQLSLNGTLFQMQVFAELQKIPYGQTVTYGQIAKKIAQSKGSDSMSARAVGGAVGHNPISIIVPCHRVISANGKLAGYAGGADRKKRLLRLEGIILK